MSTRIRQDNIKMKKVICINNKEITPGNVDQTRKLTIGKEYIVLGESSEMSVNVFVTTENYQYSNKNDYYE